MSNKLGLIYGICHKKTNRWYIGQTTRGLECRWGEHLKEMTYSNRHLYCAMRKYGLDEFQIEILEDNIPTEQLDSKECYYIEKYDAYRSGFNNTTGGGGVRGYSHTEETKAKISRSVAAGSYRWNTKERAVRISKAQKGRKFTAEHRERIKEAANRNKRFGLDNPFGGRMHTEESKKKMSDSSTRFRVVRLTRNTNKELEVYENLWEASKWVEEVVKPKAKLCSIYHRITEAIHNLNGTKSAYGFLWKTMPKEDKI